MPNEEKQKVVERIIQKSSSSTKTKRLDNSVTNMIKEKTFITAINSPSKPKKSVLLNLTDEKNEDTADGASNKPSILADPNVETFKSIRDEKAKTRLVTIDHEKKFVDSIQLQKKKVKSGSVQDEDSSQNPSSSKRPILKKTKSDLDKDKLNSEKTETETANVVPVDDMAKILVGKIIEESRSQMNSPRVTKSAGLVNIERNMKYELTDNSANEMKVKRSSASRSSDRALSATVR
jgi:hypothetical protein